jgi:hypothetical protein
MRLLDSTGTERDRGVPAHLLEDLIGGTRIQRTSKANLFSQVVKCEGLFSPERKHIRLKTIEREPASWICFDGVLPTDHINLRECDRASSSIGHHASDGWCRGLSNNRAAEEEDGEQHSQDEAHSTHSIYPHPLDTS